MAIMDMFRTAFGPQQSAAPTMPGQLQTAGAQPQPQSQPGNIPAAGGATNPNNPTVPATNADGTPATASPLDQFGDMWKPVENKGAGDPLFANVDPAKLMEAAKKTNFSALITKEQQAAIAQGGTAAQEAFMQSMNLVAQNVFAQSAMATTRIVDQALAKQQEQFKALLPSLVKQHTLSDNLRSENPVFNHPSVAPLIHAMETQLAAKHPNATASELTKLAQEYVLSVGQAFNPTAGKETTAASSANSEPDWDLFLKS